MEVAPLDGPVTLYRAGGCAACGRTGYSGRVALYEVLPIRGTVRKMLERSTEEILAAALDAGMRTMRQDGARLALERGHVDRRDPPRRRREARLAPRPTAP